MTQTTLTAFAGFRRIASGPRPELLAQLRARPVAPDLLLRIFNDSNGERLDLDLRPNAPVDGETGPDISHISNEAPAARSVGRPKLGVVAREVTLLPRHWEWLGSQPGGASVTLRRLIDETRKASEGKVTARVARENAYRFMSEMAGDLAGFEEATRALFAGERQRFEALTGLWPDDLRSYLNRLAESAWSAA
jgi:hypothetical protein